MEMSGNTISCPGIDWNWLHELEWCILTYMSHTRSCSVLSYVFTTSLFVLSVSCSFSFFFPPFLFLESFSVSFRWRFLFFVFFFFFLEPCFLPLFLLFSSLLFSFVFFFFLLYTLETPTAGDGLENGIIRGMRMRNR